MHNLADGLNTGGLENFLRNNVVNLLILVVAAGMLLLANKGEYRQAMTRVGIVVAALFVLGLVLTALVVVLVDEWPWGRRLRPGSRGLSEVVC